MSRIGKTPIIVPKDVTLTHGEGAVEVKGPKGTLHVSVPPGLHIVISPTQIEIKTQENGRKLHSIHGLFRSVLANAVTGVTTGWQKTVELVGVGYRAMGGGNEVTLQVGFTHSVKKVAPKDINFKIIDTKIIISGIDKMMVGEIAAQIRAVRPPEPYKGKGIRYAGEVIRKKAGKAVKAAGAPA